MLSIVHCYLMIKQIILYYAEEAIKQLEHLVQNSLLRLTAIKFKNPIQTLRNMFSQLSKVVVL